MPNKKVEPQAQIPTRKQAKTRPIQCEGHRQRMMNRLLQQTGYALPERDLLEILLYYSIRRADTRDQAIYLMQANQNSIHHVLHADINALTAVPGIGNSTALMLRVMGAAVSRIRFEKSPSPPADSLLSAEQIAAMFREHISQTDEEMTWIAVFDSAMHLCRVEPLICGRLQRTPTDMRLLLDYSARYHASHIALAEVGSGVKAFPNQQDMALAQHIRQVFAQIGRNLMEYLMIHDTGYLSLNSYLF